MKEYWLNTDCKVVMEDVSNLRKKVYITTPERIKKKDVEDIWAQLQTTLGKYEFEMWLAEKIVLLCMRAIVENKEIADVSELMGATFYRSNDDEDWYVDIKKESFQRILVSLPIFRKVKESKDEVFLEYVF